MVARNGNLATIGRAAGESASYHVDAGAENGAAMRYVARCGAEIRRIIIASWPASGT